MHYTPSTIPDEALDALRPAFDDAELESVEFWIGECKRGNAQLWSDGSYWLISRVVLGKSGPVLHLGASAGVFSNALIDEVEDWGKSVGCVKVVAEVRPGLTRRRPGYAQKRIIVEKGL